MLNDVSSQRFSGIPDRTPPARSVRTGATGTVGKPADLVRFGESAASRYRADDDTRETLASAFHQRSIKPELAFAFDAAADPSLRTVSGSVHSRARLTSTSPSWLTSSPRSGMVRASIGLWRTCMA